MILLGLLLWFGAEVAAFIAVGEQIGFWLALGLLIVVSALGPFVVRRVGLGVVAHTQERLARGEPPTRELLDGLLVLLGGTLLCVPGFIGDALGLALMFGPVRHVFVRVAGHRVGRRVRTMSVTRWTAARRGPVVDARTHPTNPADGGDPPALRR